MKGLERMGLSSLMFYAMLVLALLAGILLVSHVLGQRHNERATGLPYESGIPPTKPAHARVAVRYYVVALFFIVFDIEAAFLFAWASAARELGWRGYFGAMVFIGVLAVALLYEWRLGILDFGPDGTAS